MMPAIRMIAIKIKIAVLRATALESPLGITAMHPL
jgi:hypothetical protein